MSSIHITDPAEFGYQQWFNKPSSSIVRPNIFDSSDLIKIVLLPLPPLVCITTVAPRKYKIFANNPHIIGEDFVLERLARVRGVRYCFVDHNAIS